MTSLSPGKPDYPSSASSTPWNRAFLCPAVQRAPDPAGKVLDRTAGKTQDAGQPNPHSQHDGALPCTECHKGHQKGVNYCGQCHSFTYKVP